MNTIHVVVGAGYGDEGKGRTVDDIASRLDHSCVIRYSGGSQASHSVVTPDGIRHAFRHIGSNTFNVLDGRIACTHLAPNFLVDFAHLYLELTQIEPVRPTYITIHPECRVVTMYDILLNQLNEIVRGDYAHGSCGMGIGETVQRNDAGVTLTVMDFCNGKAIEKIPKLIDYFFEQYDTIFERDEIACTEYLTKMGILDMVDRSNCQFLPIIGGWESVKPFITVSDKPAMANSWIFEGSQGLLLDTMYWSETNPHTTWSSVGFSRASQDITQMLSFYSAETEIEVNYVTRCYVTRHGNGPLKHDLGTTPIYGHACINNTTNEFQGSIRYAPLDINVLIDAIVHDMKLSKSCFNRAIVVNIVVTCMDETDQYQMVIGGKLDIVNKSVLLRTISAYASLKIDDIHPNVKFGEVRYTDQANRQVEVRNVSS